MLFYVSFMLTAVMNSFLLKSKSYDAVYATSPPLFVGIAGLAISLIRRIPFIFENYWQLSPPHPVSSSNRPAPVQDWSNN